jgi:hypothetical protein
MLNKFRELLFQRGNNLNITGSRGGGDDEEENKDKEKKNEPSDPFADFDFNRFRTSRSKAGRNPDDDGIGSRPGGFTFDWSNFVGGGGGGTGGAGTAQVSLPKPSRGAIIGMILALIVLVLIFAVPALVSFWTDTMWFNEIGQIDVLWTNIWAKVLPFIAGALITFIFIMANIFVARRVGSRGPMIDPQNNPIAAIVGGSLRALNVLFVIGAIIVSLVLAGALSNGSQTILNFLNAAPWTDIEPIFNRPVGYYVFELPFYQFIQGWLIGLVIVGTVASLLVYALNFGLSGTRFTLTTGIKSHLSLLGALLLGLFAVGYQFENSKLVYSPRGVVPGASATDVEAQVPANNILTIIVALAAVLLLANIFIRNQRLSTRLFIGAGVVWLGATVVIGGIFPNFYQNFSVKPNEITKESQYIDNTIKQTRKAYGLDNVKRTTVSSVATLNSNDVAQNPLVVENVRLWDFDKVQTVYDQREALRRYYNFTDIDIDRYMLDLKGTGNPALTQVMIGARELQTSQLDPRAQTWQSRHLQYTHGYGFQASPVNQTDRDGRPVNLVTQSFPISTTGALKIDQPRVYYGESFDNRTDYALINTRLKEIDYPFTDGAGDATYTYTGKGGIRMDNFFVKAAFALKLGDINLLVSGDITDQTKLLINRKMTDRIKLVAPFFLYDSDPYLVVAGGRMYWILDAYTTSNLYPHADYLDRRTANLNYIRNSVKVITDAYDGTMTFYISDAKDPIIQTYAKIYPNLFKSLNTMPAELRPHLRYPEFLFSVQAQMYTTYHVSDSVVFYNRSDQWEKPLDPRTNTNNAVFQPYYLLSELPGETKSEFLLIQPIKPQGANRLNLVAWMAARSDGDNYGQIVVYDFPGQVNINGPQQFFAFVNQDQEFSRDRTLVSNAGSTVQPGPLQIIPVENSLLYVLPYYLTSSQNPIPTMWRVAVGTTDNRIVVRPTLEQALTDVFRAQQVVPGTGPGTGTGQPQPTPGAGQPQPTTGAGNVVSTPGAAGTPLPLPSGTNVNDLIRSAQDKLARADAARRAGDNATYEREYQSAQQDLRLISQLLGIR